ncbi:hypothetical protein KJ575_01145 [Patescibacteria group bacterium]|nr:hypothetical protein [Patescibacteria group bacterium]
MYNPISSIKSQKPIVKFVLLIILIIVFILALSLIIFEYANKYNPKKNYEAVQQRPKTEQEIIDSLTAPVSGEKQPSPVSAEVLDSLTAPVKTNNNSTPVPAPVSKEIIDSLTAPAVK